MSGNPHNITAVNSTLTFGVWTTQESDYSKTAIPITVSDRSF